MKANLLIQQLIVLMVATKGNVNNLFKKEYSKTP